jgi:serine/threonine protein kinase
LEHPSIVPVYGMMIGADGRPCYAMRFISGETLHDAVLRIQAARQATRDVAQGVGLLRRLLADDARVRNAAERSMAERQLLNHLIAVCNAVAYAHSRGIIHRDLKPQNVMLGKFGETLVVDWGLARVFKRSPAERVTGEDSLVPTSQQAQDLTLSGQIVGTPAYMSPEQAAGQMEALSPASDIYSLGATLYFLLTGQAPIREPNLQLLLAKVQFGEILPPRKVKRSVPPGLDAICRKAMALRPEDRYATAQELALDISRWLADEPVMCWREPLGERFQRLTRKHAAAVAGLGAGLMLLWPLFNMGMSILPKYSALNASSDAHTAVMAKLEAETKANKLALELLNLRREPELKKLNADLMKSKADLMKSKFEKRLFGLASAYFRASTKLGHLPKGSEELGPFIKDDEDRLSPRDGKPFVIAWGVDYNPLAPMRGLNHTLLAWEAKPDEEGRRWVFQGNARFVDRCEFQDLTQQAAPVPVLPIKIPLPPGITILTPLVETTEVNGYKARVVWAKTHDENSFQVIVKLSKTGKVLGLSAGEVQVSLLAEGNKPLPLKNRWPDPAKPEGAAEKKNMTVTPDGRVTADYKFVFEAIVPREKLVALELTIKGQQKRLLIPAPQEAGKK